MAGLKRYEDVQKEKGAEPPKLTIRSGAACTEPKCNGEMMIVEPMENHPEYPLKRAICEFCGWKGWI